MEQYLELLRTFCILTSFFCIYLLWRRAADSKVLVKYRVDLAVACSHIGAIVAIQLRLSALLLVCVTAFHILNLLNEFFRWKSRSRLQRKIGESGGV